MIIQIWDASGEVKYFNVTWSDEAGFEACLDKICDTEEDLDGLTPLQRVTVASFLMMENEHGED